MATPPSSFLGGGPSPAVEIFVLKWWKWWNKLYIYVKMVSIMLSINKIPTVTCLWFLIYQYVNIVDLVMMSSLLNLPFHNEQEKISRQSYSIQSTGYNIHSLYHRGLVSDGNSVPALIKILVNRCTRWSWLDTKSSVLLLVTKFYLKQRIQHGFVSSDNQRRSTLVSRRAGY